MGVKEPVNPNKSDNIVLGKCKLCQIGNLVLVEHSHIYPLFFYNDSNFFAQNRKTFSNGTHPLSNKEVDSYKNKQGVFEKHIMCKGCETIISNYEGYGAKFLRNLNQGEHIYFEDNIHTYQFFKGVDYKKFKLFFLSLYWRGSISTDIHCRYSKLPKSVEEQLRSMVYEEDPGHEMQFPMIFNRMERPEGLKKEIIAFPFRLPDGSYGTIITGLMIYLYFEMESILKNKDVFFWNIKRNGTLNIQAMDLKDSKYLIDIIDNNIPIKPA